MEKFRFPLDYTDPPYDLSQTVCCRAKPFNEDQSEYSSPLFPLQLPGNQFYSSKVESFYRLPDFVRRLRPFYLPFGIKELVVTYRLNISFQKFSSEISIYEVNSWISRG